MTYGERYDEAVRALAREIGPNGIRVDAASERLTRLLGSANLLHGSHALQHGLRMSKALRLDRKTMRVVAA